MKEYIRKVNNKRYCYISIGNNKVKMRSRVLLEKKLGRELKKEEVAWHKDGNSLNDNIDNLELITSQESLKRSSKLKRKPPKHRTILSKEDIKWLFRNIERGVNTRSLSKIFNISYQSVRRYRKEYKLKNIIHKLNK